MAEIDISKMSFNEAAQEYKRTYEKAERLLELMDMKKGNHIEFDKLHTEMNETRDRLMMIIEYIRIIAGNRSVEGRNVKEMADQAHRSLKNFNGPRLIKRKKKGK